MLQHLFHAWERRLAAATTNRVVRPFDWGLDWIPVNGLSNRPASSQLTEWVEHVMSDTDAFFTPAPTTDYSLSHESTDGARLLTFPSAFTTRHEANNTVYGRLFAPRRRESTTDRRAAVLVLPQWNSDEGGHIGLSKLLAMNGMTALRLSLPYHDRRMPPDLKRADYIVSSNIVRTLQVCRQAVRDVRLALWWLRDQGYERLGLLGTSLGSCLSYLTTCHEPLVSTQALNHVSPFFGDVVWRGLSTEHVRQGLEGHVGIDQLRDLWRPI